MDVDREQRTGSMAGESTGGFTQSAGAGNAGLGNSDDAGVRAGSFDRKFENEADSIGDKASEKLEEGREKVEETLDAGRERLSGAVEMGKNRLAEQLERLGDRIEDRAGAFEEAGGAQARAGQLARRTSTALDSGANYLRSHDPAAMRDDLESTIRERPLLSVGVAVGAGFLLARILRD